MIYAFNEKSIPKLEQIGGKAKALMQTTKAGFTVPKGIVLSVDFFEPWLTDIKLSNEWKELLKDITKANCDNLKIKAENMVFTANMKAIFNEKISLLNGEVFAIRSSSPEEDLKGTSFAGMYETLLGQKRNMLEQAVAEAFSSCFDFRVMEYKKNQGIDISFTTIAIIVQRQIASTISGVGFSLNPLNNAYDEVMINASFGLGESIVSGIVSPDTYIFESVKNRIIHKKINNKQIGLWLNQDGGIYEKPNEEPKKQALNNKQIFEVSKLIKKCEKYYNMPMDIEWAYENEKLYLLQSRPITTYIPLFEELVTKAGKPKNLYIDIMGLTQGFTDSMSVLGMEHWKGVVESIKGEIMICSPDGTTPVLHGRQYINISYLSKLFGKKLAASFVNNYDGNTKKIWNDRNIKEYLQVELPDSLRGKKLNFYKMMLKYVKPSIKTLISKRENILAEYNCLANSVMKKADNIDYNKNFEVVSNNAIKHCSKVMSSAGIIISGQISFMRLKKMFKKYDVEEDFAAISMDLIGNPTSEMGHLMFDIAKDEAFINITNKQEFVKRYEEKDYPIDFMQKMNKFMKKFGVRGFKEIDIATKRVYEDLGSFYDTLKGINVEDSQIRKAKLKRKKSYNKLLAIAKRAGFEKKFVKAIENFQATFGYREHPKYVIVYVLARLHDYCMKLGEEFVKEGRLEYVEQIFDLKKSEIGRAQKDKNYDLLAARNKNLKPYNLTKHVKSWPLVIDSRGKIIKPKLELKEGDYVGTPISLGVVRGRAKVLNSPYEKPLNSGEILVTKCSEPSWTPIFINAVGVVMEIGGPLQHGGIIAREYGIPCVSGLLGITEIIKDGDLIEVDGNKGVVRILKS